MLGLFKEPPNVVHVETMTRPTRRSSPTTRSSIATLTRRKKLPDSSIATRTRRQKLQAQPSDQFVLVSYAMAVQIQIMLGRGWGAFHTVLRIMYEGFFRKALGYTENFRIPTHDEAMHCHAFQTKRFNMSTEIMCLLDENSNLVGCVCYTTMFSRTDNTKAAYIGHVYAPGHGAVTMRMLQDHLKSLGVSILLLEIPDHDRHQERILRAFYDRQGYTRGDSRYLSPDIQQFLESVQFRTKENLRITGKFLNGIEWKHLMAKAV